jgi:hypothetical protein
LLTAGKSSAVSTLLPYAGWTIGVEVVSGFADKVEGEGAGKPETVVVIDETGIVVETTAVNDVVCDDGQELVATP